MEQVLSGKAPSNNNDQGGATFQQQVLFQSSKKETPNKAGKIETIRGLLKLCQSKKEVDDRNSDGDSAFIAAFENEKDPACLLEIIDLFWKRYKELKCDLQMVLLQANGEEKDSHIRCSPFHTAVNSKDEKVIRRVLSFYREADIFDVSWFRGILQTSGLTLSPIQRSYASRILEAFMKENGITYVASETSQDTPRATRSGTRNTVSPEPEPVRSTEQSTKRSRSSTASNRPKKRQARSTGSVAQNGGGGADPTVTVAAPVPTVAVAATVPIVAAAVVPEKTASPVAATNETAAVLESPDVANLGVDSPAENTETTTPKEYELDEVGDSVLRSVPTLPSIRPKVEPADEDNNENDTDNANSTDAPPENNAGTGNGDGVSGSSGENDNSVKEFLDYLVQTRTEAAQNRSTMAQALSDMDQQISDMDQKIEDLQRRYKP